MLYSKLKQTKTKRSFWYIGAHIFLSRFEYPAPLGRWQCANRGASVFVSLTFKEVLNLGIELPHEESSS